MPASRSLPPRERLYEGSQGALLAAGCVFKRPGKGDHEIWFSPLTNRAFTVDGAIKSRHTANGTLKDAGLPKAF